MIYFLFLLLLWTSGLLGTTINVNHFDDTNANDIGVFNSLNDCDLRGALNYALIFNDTYLINFNTGSPQTISLQNFLPMINEFYTENITIDGGNNVTIQGGSYRGFFIRQGNSSNPVTIQNITIANCQATGGPGGDPGGGGGAGLGGGIFVAPEVTTNGCFLNNITINSCNATGGNGGILSSGSTSQTGGGGGGMGGGGGSGSPAINAGGGGGGGLLGGGGGNGENGGGAGGGGAAGRGGDGGGDFSGGGGGGGTGTAIGGFASDHAQNGGSSGKIMGLFIAGGGGGANNQTGSGFAGFGGGNGGSANAGGGASGGGGGSVLGAGGDGGIIGGVSFGGPGGVGGGGGGGSTLGGAGNGPGNGGAGGINGGGGGSGGPEPDGTGGNGGYGGGGGACLTSGAGSGGFGGGGGANGNGQASAPIGNGGFGGGAGAGGSNGGLMITGGFGGGGGGAFGGTVITGGVGGGNGNTATDHVAGGGSGAGLGGGIFAGGWVSVNGLSMSGNSVAQGSGGDGSAGVGIAAAADIFILSGTYTDASGTYTGAGVFTLNPPANTTITLNSSIGDDSSNTIPAGHTWVAGTASGGSLLQNGAGTTLLTGINTYAGGTVINNGILQIPASTALGKSDSNLTFSGNGTLQFSGNIGTSNNPIIINSGVTATFDTNTHTGTLSNSISTGSASSTLLKISAGTLTLSGSNSYNGTTEINGGTLQAGSTTGLSPNSNFVLDSATILDLNNFSNTIGSLSSTFSNALVTLESATLTIGGNNTSTTYAGSITGTGGLTVTGTGLLTLSGNSTYIGNTTVNGNLSLTGSLDSPVVVNGFFEGTGSVNNTVIVNGTIHPGISSSGTMTVSMLFLNPGSTFDLGITPSGAPLIAITGNGTLQGTLNLNREPGNYSGLYDFITATGTITGTFSSITGIPNGAFVEVLYFPQVTELIVSFISEIGVGGKLSKNARKILHYLQSLQNIPAIHDLLVDLSILNGDQLDDALNDISPTRNFSSNFISSEVNFLLNYMVMNHLASTRILRNIEKYPTCLRSAMQAKEEAYLALSRLRKPKIPSPKESTKIPVEADYEIIPAVKKSVAAGSSEILAKDKESTKIPVEADYEIIPAVKKSVAAGSSEILAKNFEKNDFWVARIGNYIREDGQHGNPNIHDTSLGVIVGYDSYMENGSMAVSAGYVNNQIHETGGVGQGQSKGGVLGFYGTGYIIQGYLEAGLLGSYNHFKMNRDIIITRPFPFITTAKSNYNVWEIVLHFGGGYDATLNWGIIEPFASFDCAAAIQGKYAETSAGALNMIINASAPVLLRSQIGINFYEAWDTETSVCILQESASYVNKKPFNTHMKAALIIGPPSAYGVPGTIDLLTYDEVFNLGALSLEVFYKHKKTGFFFSANYEGEFGPSYMSNNIQGTVGVFF